MTEHKDLIVEVLEGNKIIITDTEVLPMGLDQYEVSISVIIKYSRNVLQRTITIPKETLR